MSRQWIPPVVVDPWACATVAGLRYVSDREPGIRRRRVGRAFTYLDPQGRKVQDAAVV